MTSVTLLHPKETFKIPALQVITKCKLFQNNPALLVSPYRVQSSVSLSIFREFLSELEGNAIKITDTNFTKFQRLCKGFGFSEFSAKLSKFRPSRNFKEVEDANARGRIAALEEKVQHCEYEIAILQSEVRQLSTDFGHFISEVSALRSAAAGIQTLLEEVSTLKTQIAQKLNDPVMEQLSTDFSKLRDEVLTLKAQIAAISPTLTPSHSSYLFCRSKPLRLPRHRSENRVPQNSAKISGKPEMIRESNDGTGGCCGES
jgi:hypothetical protein